MSAAEETQTHTPHKRQQLAGIQLLRGLAALLVVLGHANGMMRYPEYFGASPFVMPDIGGFGVGVFFVISGFIIVIVTLDASGKAKMGIRDYAWRRFIRIVPFMWLCTVGYNIFTYLGTGTVEWVAALRALVVWPVGELKPNVLWSLRHEFLFYLLFGLTMLGGRQRPGLLIAWFLAPLILYTVLLPFDPATTAWHPYSFELARVWLLGSETGANLQIGLGFALGLVWLKRAAWTQAWLRHGLLLTTAAFIAATAIMLWAALPPGLGRTVLWTALSGIVIYLGIVTRPSATSYQSLGLVLGNASFAIYLVHNPLLLILLEASGRFTSWLPPVAWLTLFVCLATIGGVAVHYLAERPLIAFLSKGRRVAPWLLPRRSAQP
jgi:peptidoglycan/LPS O-acetylase OafA/YrhL